MSDHTEHCPNCFFCLNRTGKPHHYRKCPLVLAKYPSQLDRVNNRTTVKSDKWVRKNESRGFSVENIRNYDYFEWKPKTEEDESWRFAALDVEFGTGFDNTAKAIDCTVVFQPDSANCQVLLHARFDQDSEVINPNLVFSNVSESHGWKEGNLVTTTLVKQRLLSLLSKFLVNQAIVHMLITWHYNIFTGGRTLFVQDGRQDFAALGIKAKDIVDHEIQVIDFRRYDRLVDDLDPNKTLNLKSLAFGISNEKVQEFEPGAVSLSHSSYKDAKAALDIGMALYQLLLKVLDPSYEGLKNVKHIKELPTYHEIKDKYERAIATKELFDPYAELREMQRRLSFLYSTGYTESSKFAKKKKCKTNCKIVNSIIKEGGIVNLPPYEW